MSTDTGAGDRLKRARTGCLKCRIRRRKCDEGKPACQRCKDGRFECKYGVRLSFLDKNAIAVSDSTSNRRTSYSTLRFIEPESTTSKLSTGLQSETSLQRHVGRLMSPVATSQSSTEDGGEGPTELSDLADVCVSSPLAQAPEYFRHDIQTPGHYAIGTSPSNANYETALSVLMSLGNGSIAPPAGPANSGGYYLTSPPTVRGYSPSVLNGNQVNWPVKALTNRVTLPHGEVVQLLSHYRYNVATWLDVGDPGQTCGLQMCRLAMESTASLESLLALSLISVDRRADLKAKGLEREMANLRQLRFSDMDTLGNLAIAVFESVRQYITTSPQSWRSPFKILDLESLNSSSAHEQYSKVRLAASWILLRLDLSVGIMTSCSVTIPDVLVYGDLSPAISGITRDCFEFDREPLLLCAKVVNHCFESESAQSSGMYLGSSTAQNWKALLEALNIWYSNRPRELKPMLELEDNDQLFPLVIFTNGAAVLANQLYHTAMLLLLQNRPRTLRSQRGRSAVMSPLWHAQRVCGISLNNDSRDSWDFSLVASFHLAAKRMTYEPQQRLVLSGLNRIAATTGWNMEGLSDQLAREWQSE